MADYFPLIAKAVAGLEKNTGEARRVLYERARKALVGQLRNMNPPLTESEITRERLALEEAIRKVEAEAARRMRLDQRIDETPAEKPAEPAAISEPTGEPTPSVPPPPPSATPPSEAPAESAPPASPQGDEPAGKSAESGRGRFFRRSRAKGERSNIGDQGLKGFRDVVAEAEGLGDKTAQGAKAAREAYSTVPGSSPDLDRVEPRIEPEGLRGSMRDAGAPRTTPIEGQRVPSRDVAGRRPIESPPRPVEARTPQGRAPQRRGTLDVERVKAPPRSRRGLVAALLSLVVIFALALGAIWNRDRIAAFFGAVRGLTPQAQREAGPPKPKIPDRVGQEGQQASAPRPAQPQPTTPPPQVAAVAQRVVLYEEDPAEPAGKRYVGSAIWRTETVSPGPGLPPELAVRCDVEIPERRLGMTMSIRRNADPALPASHTIEIMFNLPADFLFGGVNNVPGILMKQAEQTRGSPLSGLAVKVTGGFFLVGLSAVETETQRNIELLKERAWFDIPVVYNNGRRAILAIEKGNPGERVFAEAFTAWKQ
jgi:hypothetical protein